MTAYLEHVDPDEAGLEGGLEDPKTEVETRAVETRAAELMLAGTTESIQALLDGLDVDNAMRVLAQIHEVASHNRKALMTLMPDSGIELNGMSSHQKKMRVRKHGMRRETIGVEAMRHIMHFFEGHLVSNTATQLKDVLAAQRNASELGNEELAEALAEKASELAKELGSGSKSTRSVAEEVTNAVASILDAKESLPGMMFSDENVVQGSLPVYDDESY